ncbi:MAG: DUF2213 domain-containing protein [Petrotogales bacterium]
MPWKPGDADKHKKGLTGAQKKKWAKIANSARSSCLKKGGSEKECDASAIRIANSQVNVNLLIYSESQPEYIPETREWEGKQYLIIPVVMMTEGVHSGSHGAIYHGPEELGKIVDSWNGIPVTISHPINEQGEFVSANDPSVLSSWAVGQIFNAYMDGVKLKAEAWIDVQRLAAVSPETLTKVQAGEIIEVSVGIFSDEEEIEGYWNNEQYTAVAKNYRPDHLALLPGEVGACSVSDGCGVRTNKQKGGNDVEILKVLKDLSKKGLSVSPMTNEVSFHQIMDQLYSLVDGKDTDSERFYLEDVYDNYFIYRKRAIQRTNDEISSSEYVGLFKQNYQVGADDKVELVGDPVEVKKNVTFVTLKDEVNNNKQKKEVKVMACVKCPEKVEELITHSATHFEEADRDWLNDLSEDKLDKLIPKRVRTNNDTETMTLDKAKDFIQANMKAEDRLSLLTDDMKSQYEAGVKIYKEQRDETIKSIMDNTEEGTWTKDELEVMKLDVLKKLEKSVKKSDSTVHVNSTGGNGKDKDSVEPMLIPSMEFDKK